MKLKMYSTYDSKVQAWTVPFYMSETQSIEREWIAACNDPESRYAQHPDDYSLFELGEFEIKSGKHIIHTAPISIGLARHFVTPKKEL